MATIAPLPDICEVADEYGAMVMVDDAHAFGVLGEYGGGTVDHFRLKNRGYHSTRNVEQSCRCRRWVCRWEPYPN